MVKFDVLQYNIFSKYLGCYCENFARKNDNTEGTVNYETIEEYSNCKKINNTKFI